MKDTIHDNIRCSGEDLLPIFRYSLKYSSVNSRKPPAEVTIIIESSVELSPCSLFNLSKVALRLSTFNSERSERSESLREVSEQTSLTKIVNESRVLPREARQNCFGNLEI